MEKRMILQVDDLCKRFGSTRAIDHVSFSIEEGTTLGLVGESGCGKSTLGKAVLNLLNIDKGEILYKNDNIFDFKKDKLKTYPFLFCS